jgi:hypothetical protein
MVASSAVCVACAGPLLAVGDAKADDRTAATAAAVVPGALVHGSGHWTLGRRDTARMLLYGELVGIGAMGAGFGTLYVTGASRKIAAPAIASAIFGTGLFVVSWLADIDGSATDGLGQPRRVLPPIEASLGLRFVKQPAFADQALVVTGFDLRLGRVRVSPEGWFGAGRVNERLRLETAYRFAGATTRRAPDGSFIDVTVAGVRHAFPADRFATSSVELGVSGRYDLARIHLPGSFADGSIGYALMRHDYAGAPSDATEQLLARWAYGVWIGRPSSTWGEVSVFYEHRHDGYAAGFVQPGLFSGVLGSFGGRALAWLTEDLGALAEAQIGAGIVAGASVLVRQPVMP